jgi:hypothetical protein
MLSKIHKLVAEKITDSGILRTGKSDSISIWMEIYKQEGYGVKYTLDSDAYHLLTNTLITARIFKMLGTFEMDKLGSSTLLSSLSSRLHVLLTRHAMS